jgi:hypothetical protein
MHGLKVDHTFVKAGVSGSVPLGNRLQGKTLFVEPPEGRGCGYHRREAGSHVSQCPHYLSCPCADNAIANLVAVPVTEPPLSRATSAKAKASPRHQTVAGFSRIVAADIVAHSLR